MGPGKIVRVEISAAGLTVHGSKVNGSLHDGPLMVSSVYQLLLGIEDEVALHEDAWAWWPQSWQHVRCIGMRNTDVK